MAIAAVITDNGKALAIKRVYGTSVTAVSTLRLGRTTTTATVTDTDVNYLLPIQPTLLNKCDNAGDWTGSTDAITPTTHTATYKEGYGTTDNTCLNIGKSGTTQAYIYYQDSIASTNLSGSKYLWAWLYIVNAAALAKIASVSLYVYQSSNYRYWTVSAASLSTGWNLIESGVMTSYTGQSGTAPTMSAIDKYELRVNTNNASDTFTLGDLKMDFFHYDSYTSACKTILAGYPTYSLARSTTRYYINAAEALGYSIGNFGEFNTDSTPLMFSHDSLDTAHTKTSEIEMHYILEHEVQDA